MEIFKLRLIALLRWSERYTRTDMVYLSKNTFWMLGGQFAILISTFFLSWYFANFVSKEIYGQYKFVISVTTILAICALPGMGVVLTSYLSRSQLISLSKTITIKMQMGLLGTVVSLGISLYYYIQDNSSLATLFFITALFIPIYESYGDYQFVLQAKERFNIQILYRIYQRIFFVICMISLLSLTDNIIFLVLVHLLCTTVSNYFFYRKVQRNLPQEGEMILTSEQKRYGLHLTAMNGFATISTHVDKLLLFHLLGPVYVANYFFAITMPQEMAAAAHSVSHIAFPKLAKQSNTAIKKHLPRKIIIYILALSVPVGTYIYLAPFIFTYLFPAYINVVAISQVAALLTLFVPITLIWQYLYAKGFKKLLYIYTISSPMFLIILFLLFLPTWGIWGAVYALIGRGFYDCALGFAFILNLKEE